jgi:hypothetical protein
VALPDEQPEPGAGLLMAATKGKKAAPRKKGAAARSEKSGKAKVVDFRGLELKLPTKLPGTILFDLADLETGNDLRGVTEFLKSVVGAGQYQAIRNKVAEDGITIDEVDQVLLGLFEDILETAGLGSGE